MAKVSDRDKIFYLFRDLPREEQKRVPKQNEGFLTEFTIWTSEANPLRPSWLEQPENQLLPNTFDTFVNRFPNYASVVITPPAANTRSNDGPYRGGSRRSLQKSRLVKRKSRKYKSIKKSKKRSFRNRGRH